MLRYMFAVYIIITNNVAQSGTDKGTHIIPYINKYMSTIYKYCVIWAKVKQILLPKDCLKLLFRMPNE